MELLEVRQRFLEHKGAHIRADDEDFGRLSEYILSDQCVKDIERLKNGDYFFSPPTRFKIKKIASNRHRTCFKFAEPDNFILKLCSFVLLDFDGLYEKSLYSFRKSYNHSLFFERLKYTDFGRKYFVLKMDIHSYGESVDQDILLEKLYPILGDDTEFYSFLKWMLKINKYYEKGELIEERCSMIPGIPIGSFLNNVYLLEIDKYLKEKSVLSMRYTDDIAAIVRTREEAEEIRDHLLSEFNRLYLTCNPDKTVIYEPKEPFSILGIKVSPYEYDIAELSVHKILFKLEKRRNHLLKLVRTKAITQEKAFISGKNFATRLFEGRDGDPSSINWMAWTFNIITTDKTLKFIDRHVEEFLRSVKCGKTGKTLYRVKYEELRKAGYVTLVNKYHKNHEELEKNRGKKLMCTQ